MCILLCIFSISDIEQDYLHIVMQRRPPLLPGGPSGGRGHGHNSHGGVPGGGGGSKMGNSLQLDYDRRRKVAIKCLELEEMLMSQG